MPKQKTKKNWSPSPEEPRGGGGTAGIGTEKTKEKGSKGKKLETKRAQSIEGGGDGQCGWRCAGMFLNKSTAIQLQEKVANWMRKKKNKEWKKK